MTSYQPLSTDRTDVVRAKRTYGIWYGATLGLIFAAFTWGLDAFFLSRMNTLYPWTKFVAGAVPCMMTGGLAGWLAARREKPVIAFLIWGVLALFFAWLVVSLPTLIMPRLLGLLDPDVQAYLHYVYYAEFSTRIGVAFAWIVIFVSIAGILQLPLSESAVFSTSILGKVAPMLVGLVLMGISGTIVDGLNNELLRSPVAAMNETIQFYVDHRGQTITPLESRQKRQGSLRAIKDIITPQRQLIVSGYDAYLGEVNVLVRFDKAWVECLVFYAQPVNCKQVGTIP